VLDAINADPRLSGRQRSALAEVYGAFVGAPPRRRGARNRTDRAR